ncbi:hypothetical protein [uncultured Roseibium sp.]|uniref:PIN-like domain-containing protein n=1 Tax=uncultured Roseibium sp. TaxID=1936171 RepID=UPI003217B6B3
MNVFFDNCTSPILATALDGFIKNYGHRALHIRSVSDLKLGRSTPDIEWLKYLSESKEFWIFVTGDKRIRKNKAEREALRSVKLHGFILAPSFQKTPMNQVVSNLIWKWPEIEKLVEITAPPAIFDIPTQRGAKLKPLPL